MISLKNALKCKTVLFGLWKCILKKHCCLNEKVPNYFTFEHTTTVEFLKGDQKMHSNGKRIKRTGK